MLRALLGYLYGLRRKSFFVKVMEDELAALAELRMKEESATELSVGLFDTKRNLRVQKGRETQERERREREKSEVGFGFVRTDWNS